MTAQHHVAGAKPEEPNRKSSFKPTEQGQDAGTGPSFYKVIPVLLIVGKLTLTLVVLALAAAVGAPLALAAMTTKPSNQVRVILVCRVSTKKQAEEDKRSLSDQLTKLLRWAKEKRWVVVGDPIMLEGASGAKENAPQWKLIQELLTNGDANAVAFTSVDRFARSALIGLRHLYKWSEAGHTVFIGGEAVNIEDPIMMFRIIIELACSQLKHGTNLWAANTRKRRAIEEGRWYRAPPLGYEVGDLTGKLVPLEELREHVKHLFEDVAFLREGWVRALSQPAALALIPAEDCPVNSRRRITRFLKLLRQPAYAGLIEADGELHTPALEEGEEFAIISRELYDEVQACLGTEHDRKSAMAAFTKALERVSWIRVLQRLFEEERVTCRTCKKPIRFSGVRLVKSYDSPVVTCDCDEEHRLFAQSDFESVTAFRCFCGENRVHLSNVVPPASFGLHAHKQPDRTFKVSCLTCRKAEWTTTDYPFPVKLPNPPEPTEPRAVASHPAEGLRPATTQTALNFDHFLGDVAAEG